MATRKKTSKGKAARKTSSSVIQSERIERSILMIRGHKVMLDADLAALYGVATKVLNQAVTRNTERFPDDFMFRLTAEEHEALRSQIVTLETGGRGQHTKYPPRVFTEQGVAMLASVLRSRQAVQVNIEIMRAFVRMRDLLARDADLTRRLGRLEKKYDGQFKVVFDAIRQLMSPPTPAEKKRKIGFLRDDED